MRIRALLIAALGAAGIHAPRAWAGPIVGHSACDEIAGHSLAQNARWRIVATSWKSDAWALADPTIVVACRRTGTVHARVRVLRRIVEFGTHTTGWFTGPGTALLADQSGSSGGYSVDYRLVDLDHARAARVAKGFASYNEGSFRRQDFAITPGGGLLRLSWSSDTSEASSAPLGGPLVVWGRSGISTLPGLVAISVAPSLGDATNAGGAYVLSRDRAVSRVAVDGAPDSTGWRASPRLAWQSRRLLVDPVPPGATRTELAPSDVEWGARIDLLEQRAPRGRPASSMIVVRDPEKPTSPTNVALATGAARDLRVLARTPMSVLVAGRFADAPAERRIRSISAPGRKQPVIDITTTPTAELAGHAVALGGGTGFAIAFDDAIRWWDGPGPPDTLAVPGAHDLAADLSGVTETSAAGATARALFFTDAAGVAQHRWLP